MFKSTWSNTPIVAVSFDLFGTLVSVDRPASPADAVAAELERRGVEIPAAFPADYCEVQIDAPEGAEVPLPAHVAAALRSRGVTPSNNIVRRAVVAAFDPNVETRPGAVEAVTAAAKHSRVGVLSNCSVPELVPRTLLRSDIDRSTLDVILSSAGCGWRKPDPRAFEAFASKIGVDVEQVIHIGDDPGADGGIEAVGGTAIVLDEHSIEDLPELLEAEV